MKIMEYEIAVRARNLIWNYPLGGAEKVAYNWLSRFRKINAHLIPVVDDVYVKMCFKDTSIKEKVEEIARKQPFRYEEDILNLYLDCKLHLNLSIYNKLDYNYVLDPVLFPDTLPLRKQLKGEGSPFVFSMLKKGSFLVSMLIGIGDINLTSSYLLINAPRMAVYGGIKDNLLLKFLYLQLIERSLLRKLMRYKERILFLATSKGVKNKLHKMEVEVVFPHFALDEDIRKYRSNEKEDYAVFFARVTALKGIYEAIKAFKLMRNNGIKSLIVIGENFSLAKPKDGVQFLGHVDKEEVYKILSRARVNLYPSHSDTFGISVLETLGVGTPVSMYYNPANYEYFSKSKNVRIAKEYDVKTLARNALELTYTEDEYTDHLINLHLNWDKVVEKVENSIIKWIEIKSK